MATVFDRAAERLDREESLLATDGADLLPPMPAVAPPPAVDRELEIANACWDSRSVPSGSRAGTLKRLVQWVLRPYTTGQTSYNGAVVRVLNAWRGHLESLGPALARHASALDERWARLRELRDERSIVLEGRLLGRLESLESRIASLEADLSEALAERDEDRRRLESLAARLAPLGESTSSPRPGRTAKDPEPR